MNATNLEGKKRKARRMHSARDKVAAVLAVWSGRRNPSRVCRDLGVNWGIVNSWEKKALAGMLKALGGETPPESSQGELGNRLEGLLAGLQRQPGQAPQTAESAVQSLPAEPTPAAINPT